MSQSPQIGSMFLTDELVKLWEEGHFRRNPLKSGQCFLLENVPCQWLKQGEQCRSQSPQIGSMFLTPLDAQQMGITMDTGRNPLKSGQCFLRKKKEQTKTVRQWSQSPQIGSMFLTEKEEEMRKKKEQSRNPLKSGQCFLRRSKKVAT